MSHPMRTATIEVKSADAMTAVSYLRFGAVPEWKAVEMKYSRKTK